MEKPNDQLIEIVREWVEKAEHDLTMAVLGLRAGGNCPTDMVCFHAQQCAEKYMKAFLVLKRIDFPKTHVLEELAELSPKPLRTVLTEKEYERLTEYAVVVRYPGEEGEISLAEARRAVRLARKVRAAIRKLLPRAAWAVRKSKAKAPRKRTNHAR